VRRTKRLLAVLLLATGLSAHTWIAPPIARALGWGAIAISPATGNVGYSQNLYSALVAEQAAIAVCNAFDCQAVVHFSSACGAVAQEAVNLSWGWGWDYSIIGAQNQALAGCSQFGAGCRVIGWTCS